MRNSKRGATKLLSPNSDHNHFLTPCMLHRTLKVARVITITELIGKNLNDNKKDDAGVPSVLNN